MITTFIEAKPNQLSLLDTCKLPQTLEDISIQMGVIVGEADIEVYHKEADRLLLKSLEIAGSHLHPTQMEHIAEIIANFHRLEKYYA